jgi:hypothetical protein
LGRLCFAQGSDPQGDRGQMSSKPSVSTSTDHSIDWLLFDDCDCFDLSRMRKASLICLSVFTEGLVYVHTVVQTIGNNDKRQMTPPILRD